MDDTHGPGASTVTPTVEELRDALRLIDPTSATWSVDVLERWATPGEHPHLLPLEMLYALTAVSPRLRKAVDDSLAGVPPADREAFERGRNVWDRVSRGEIPSPGWGVSSSH